jgi:hypothetical protein
MGIIDQPCPVCGGVVERVDSMRTGLKFDVMPRPATVYKCLSVRTIDHIPAGWKPDAPPWDQ